MKVLSNKDFTHIITWMPSGKSFAVLKPKVFTAEILPDHFKSAKYSSFTRKLHRWGFSRHYKGDEAGAFYHKEFQRDRIDLAEKMTCQKAPEPIKSKAMYDQLPQADLPNTAHGFSTDLVNEQELNQGSRRSSLPAITMPQLARRLSDTSGFQTHPLLAHAFSQPTLSIPVPKQQHSRPLYEPPRQITSFANLPDMSTSQNSLVAAKINAAIEMEVSRRLQERISVAAAQMSQIAQISRGTSAFSNLLPLTSQTPVQRSLRIGDTGSASTASLRAKLVQMQRQKEQMQYLAMTGTIPISSQGLGEMPKTNIQGAKTA